ncbi:MAG: hypothetical protein EZS28_052525, partial [Streblomastix strix]
YSSIRFKKAESNRHVSTSSEGDLPHLPTFEYKNNNTTRTGKDEHNSRCSQQIMQVRRLSPSPIISGSNKNDLEYPTNSGSIRIINNKTITTLCDSEHKRLTSPMDRCILQHMDERNPIGTPSNSNLVKSNLLPQQRNNFSNSNSTMVAGPTMVYKLNESVKHVPYPWTVKPMPNQGTKHGKSKKAFYLRERQQHSSWTRSGERKNVFNIDSRQDRTFQRSSAITHQWIEIRDSKTLPLCNENIGRILLRTWSQY